MAAIASPPPEKNQDMPDQIIDAVMARALHADAVRAHPLVTWIIKRGQSDYPDEVVARLITDAPTPYVLLADSLAGCRPSCQPA
jgi:hypothetical protein